MAVARGARVPSKLSEVIYADNSSDSSWGSVKSPLASPPLSSGKHSSISPNSRGGATLSRYAEDRGSIAFPVSPPRSFPIGGIRGQHQPIHQKGPTDKLIKAVEADDFLAATTALAEGADPNTRKKVSIVCSIFENSKWSNSSIGGRSPTPVGGFVGRSRWALGESALAVAILQNNARMVRLLLDHGADPELPIEWRIIRGRTVWTAPIWNRVIETGNWDLAYYFPSALELALGEGAAMDMMGDIKVECKEDTVLELWTNLPGSVYLSDPGTKDGDQTTYSVVEFSPNLEIIEMLLALGVHVSPDIEPALRRCARQLLGKLDREEVAVGEAVMQVHKKDYEDVALRTVQVAISGHNQQTRWVASTDPVSSVNTFAVPSFPSAPHTMKSGAQTRLGIFSIPANGLAVRLGAFYDAHTNQVLAGGLWNSGTFASTMTPLVNTQVDYNIFTERSLTQKLEKLDVRGQITASFIAGLFSVSVGGSVVSEMRQTVEGARLVFRAKQMTHWQEIPSEHLHVHDQLIIPPEATHIVTKIEYGHTAHIQFETQLSSSLAKQVTTGELDAQLKAFVFEGRLSGHTAVQSEVDELRSSLTASVTATIPNINTVATLEQAKEEWGRIPELMKNATPVAMTLHLTPINNVVTSLDKVVYALEDVLAKNSLKWLDDLLSYRAHFQMLCNQADGFSQVQRCLRRVTKSLDDANEYFRMEFKEALLAYRNGSKDAQVISDLNKKWRMSVFAEQYLEPAFSKWKALTECLVDLVDFKSNKALMESEATVEKGQNWLDKILLTKPEVQAILAMRIEGGFGLPNTADVLEKALKVDTAFKFDVAFEPQPLWLDDPDISSSFRQARHRFYSLSKRLKNLYKKKMSCVVVIEDASNRPVSYFWLKKPGMARTTITLPEAATEESSLFLGGSDGRLLALYQPGLQPEFPERAPYTQKLGDFYIGLQFGSPKRNMLTESQFQRAGTAGEYRTPVTYCGFAFGRDFQNSNVANEWREAQSIPTLAPMFRFILGDPALRSEKHFNMFFSHTDGEPLRAVSMRLFSKDPETIETALKVLSAWCGAVPKPLGAQVQPPHGGRVEMGFCQELDNGDALLRVAAIPLNHQHVPQIIRDVDRPTHLAVDIIDARNSIDNGVNFREF
ncbi:hypothetical protein HDU93_007443 [Gonapodya sp. JEL0774]|nr:hypothetical protein HDU93_007443 [Gonapodya sp. JEL0774]